MAEDAYGYARVDGLLRKQYDPHAETRTAAYEKQLRDHQRRRQGAAQQQTYSTNNPATQTFRGAAAREKAAAARNEKIAKARKFNERHARMAASHRDNESYMDDFHRAFGLDERRAPRSTGGATRGRWSASFRGDDGGVVDATRWRDGPIDPAGELIDASDRPLLCMSVSQAGDAVFGSADHACYGVDLNRVERKRRMYSKRDGHSEWVTGVAHVPGSTEVLSVGMDGRFCHWRGSSCIRELASAGKSSLSVLLVDEREPLALTAGYDGVATLWHIDSDAGSLARLAGPRPGATAAAPILSACWRLGKIACGDRDGRANLYDAATASTLATWAPRQCGHVVSMIALRGDSRELFATGTSDGRIRVWDARSDDGKPCGSIKAHVDDATGFAGAVGALEQLDGGGECNLIVSMGADKAIKVFDLRRVRDPLFDMRHHDDFPVCMATLGGRFVISGAANGVVLCHDISKEGVCCWGLGANRGAVRAIHAAAGRLVACGDDGNALSWSFA